MVENAKIGAHSCVLNPKIKDAQPSFGGKYGRMFPNLAACEVDADSAVGLGRAASRMDATLPVTDEALANPRIPAGFTVFGQFVAHDITADRSLLSRHALAGELRNSRTPRLDLESVYGDGPVGNPFLYDVEDPDKLLLGVNVGGMPDDLPRNRQGVALIGGPRNDVHLLIGQIHVAFLKFHNAVVDHVRDDGLVPERESVFEAARQLARWHYEWVLVHEFLPLSCGEETVADVLANGRRFYEPGDSPAIPVEFSDAAYRFGHAEVPEHHSLASRDLQRGAALRLPSGEAVARQMGVEPLSAEECGLAEAGWTVETPLWYYVLKEAEVRVGGAHLGPVGGRIVAEVLLGLLDADPNSYRSVEPNWRPTLPSAGGIPTGRFGMADLVSFADVV